MWLWNIQDKKKLHVPKGLTFKNRIIHQNCFCLVAFSGKIPIFGTPQFLKMGFANVAFMKFGFPNIWFSLPKYHRLTLFNTLIRQDSFCTPYIKQWFSRRLSQKARWSILAIALMPWKHFSAKLQGCIRPDLFRILRKEAKFKSMFACTEVESQTQASKRSMQRAAEGNFHFFLA